MAKATISDKNTMMSFVIPKDLKLQLTNIAEKENRSFSNLIVSAIQEYVNKYELNQEIPNIDFTITDTDDIILLLEQDLTLHENTTKRLREYYDQLIKYYNIKENKRDT